MDFPFDTTIEYQDAKGQTSRRRITVRGISDEGAGHLEAFCHHRRAPRHFRLDRIQSFITEDGEIVSPSIFLAGEPSPNAPAKSPRQSRSAWETVFGVLILCCAIFSVILGMTAEPSGIGIGIFAFVVTAGPLVALRGLILLIRRAFAG